MIVEVKLLLVTEREVAEEDEEGFEGGIASDAVDANGGGRVDVVTVVHTLSLLVDA